MRAKSGFTLVEILIVVVILGILAAIVIPQFTNASTEAKQSSLTSDLQAVRSQIELYKIQHNENLPGTQGSVSFVDALTSKTNQDGVVGTDIALFRYGPYMQSLPQNPFNDLGTVATGTSKLTAVGDNLAGWYFVTSGVDAGVFQANDNKTNVLDSDKPHSQY